MGKEIAVQPVPDSTALMAIINRAATDPQFDVLKLEKLLVMKQDWDKEQARKEFVSAMTALKADPPEVFKSHLVNFDTQKGNTSYKHATLADASSVIGAAASKHGLSHRWNVDQGREGKIKVTCVITHVLGHSESVTLESSADQSGGKNSIQAIGSAVSYLQRYTLFAAYGIAAKDQDDDGRAAGHPVQEKKLSEDLPRRPADPVVEVKIPDPVSFHVATVMKQKTTPVQFRIEAKDGTKYSTLSEEVAKKAKSAIDSSSSVRALLTKKGDFFWIDSLDGEPAPAARAFCGCHEQHLPDPADTPLRAAPRGWRHGPSLPNRRDRHTPTQRRDRIRERDRERSRLAEALRQGRRPRADGP